MKKVIFKDFFDGWKEKEVMSKTYVAENGYSFFVDEKGKHHRCMTKDVVSVEEDKPVVKKKDET